MELDPENLEHLSPEQREKALLILETLKGAKLQNPLLFYNNPEIAELIGSRVHHKQLEFHSFDTSIKAFFGGNQSGKTTAGLVDDLIQALDDKDLPEHLLKYKVWNPPFYCRILAPDFVDATEKVIFPKLKELIPAHTLVGGSWKTAYNKQLRHLMFKNGSVFTFMTYEQDPFKMGGATLHRIHYDEEPPHEHRKENIMRLVRYDGDEIFTMTPLKGLTWTYDEIWEHKDEDDDISVVEVDIDDNPWITQDAKERVLGAYSDEELQFRKSGKFIHIAGMIYSEFDPREHVIPWRTPNPNSNIIVGIDPGLGSRCAVVWVSLDSEDRMVVFDEIYVKGAIVSDVAGQIHKINTEFDIKPIYNVIDPAARDRHHQTGRSDQMEYADHGIYTIAGQNAVRPGINAVKERLQSGKLYIADNCVNIIKEMKNYRWREPPKSGEDKEKPIKKDDHLLDALRYVVMSRPYLPENLPGKPLTGQERLHQLMLEDMRNAGNQQPTHEFGGLYS